MEIDPEVQTVDRFLAAMRRVLVECLSWEPNQVEDGPQALLGYVEQIRDEWDAPQHVLASAQAAARELRRMREEVTAAALAANPPEGEAEIPVAHLTAITSWLESELADLDRLRRKKRSAQ